MKRLLFFILICSALTITMVDAKNVGDQKTTVVKADNGWNKSDENAANNVQTIADGITYYTTAEGIFINLPKATSNVKLFSLTGEVVWQGNLVQGRFFIPVRQGIYFLRINNKSYKVICK